MTDTAVLEPGAFASRPPNRVERHQLQERFLRGRELAAVGQPAARRSAIAALSQCALADPGNWLYAQALLELSLAGRPAPRLRGAWTVRRRRSQLRAAAARSDWLQVLQHAGELFRQDAVDGDLLAALARACGAWGFAASEQRYLRAALHRAPDQVDLLRYAAQQSESQARFDDALLFWERLLRLRPADTEARRHATALAESAARPAPSGVPAAAIPHDRQPAPGTAHGGPALRERLEDAALQEAARQLQRAEEAAARLETPAARAAVEERRVTLHRQELEVFAARVQRQPGDGQSVLELARRLKWLGNFRQAAEHFAQLHDQPQFAATTFRERGECLQQLRQFEAALELYERAARVAGGSQLIDEEKLAIYRAAVLGEALGRLEDARRHLTRLVAADAQFRDASSRLDKLAGIHHKSKFAHDTD